MRSFVLILTVVLLAVLITGNVFAQQQTESTQEVMPLLPGGAAPMAALPPDGGGSSSSGWTDNIEAVYLTRSNARVGIGSTDPSYKLHVAGDIYANGGWMRVSGSSGLYFQSYGGGFNMTDATWIRTYGNKSFYHNAGTMRTDGTFQVGPNGDRFIVNTSGNVGIGTISPDAKLTVVPVSNGNGINILSPTAGNTHLPFTNNWNYISGNGVIFRSASNSEKIRFDLNSGNVGIGTTSPAEKLHVNGSIRGNQSGALRISTGNGYVDIGPQNTGCVHFITDRAWFYFQKEIRVDGGYIGTYDDNLSLRTQGTTRMTIVKDNGNVGIGTTNPGTAKLAVNGLIRAKEVEIDINGWSDFVFEEDYDLMSINEVDQFIKENKHLPGIPSAKEVEANGMGVGDMQAKLLQKVEELTLYVIELKKENQELRSMISEQ